MRNPWGYVRHRRWVRAGCPCEFRAWDPGRSGDVTIPRMANLTGLANIVAELKAERTNLVTQLKHVDAALTVLGKLPGGKSYTRPQRTVSALSRRRMAAAQKARWARRSPSEVAGNTVEPKRTVSASVRRRIAAAQRRGGRG